MAKRDIIFLPDPVLRRVSEPVEDVTDAVRKLADDMLETMYDAPGIGLAAIQVGVPKRIVTIDLSREEEPKAPLVLVNPEIVWRSDVGSVHEEGCLSIPDYYADVERPASIRTRYVDRDGKPQEIEAEGLLATCIQHEVDHLDGVLFIDYLSKLKRDLVVRKFAKAARMEARERERRAGGGRAARR